jgi:hypothetical protein
VPVDTTLDPEDIAGLEIPTGIAWSGTIQAASFLDCSDSQEHRTTSLVVKTGAAPLCKRYGLPVAPCGRMVQARVARAIRRGISRRTARETPIKQNPPRKAGLHSPVARKLSCLATVSFPETANFCKPLWHAQVKCAQNQPLPGGCCCTPEAPLHSISAILPALPGFPSPQPRAPWPVWRGSVAGPVRFAALSRKAAAKLWHKARRWDRETRRPGRHGGIIGRTALAALYTLLFDFLNHRSGRLDPSLEAIAAKAGCCRRAVVDALAWLRDLGLLNWQRRCEETRDAEGRFRLRQKTNAYGLLPPSQWRGYRDDAPPPPDPAALGAPEPVPKGLSQI